MGGCFTPCLLGGPRSCLCQQCAVDFGKSPAACGWAGIDPMHCTRAAAPQLRGAQSQAVAGTAAGVCPNMHPPCPPSMGVTPGEEAYLDLLPWEVRPHPMDG